LDNHENDLAKKYSAALGANLGCLKAKGFVFSGSPQAACIVYDILRLFPSNTVEANLIHVNGTVSDASWFSNPTVGISNSPAGVPSLTLDGDDGHLYWYVDSNGDTVSVFDPNQLDICLGMYAAVTYVLADLTDLLPR
jgi:carboxypeptidase Q